MFDHFFPEKLFWVPGAFMGALFTFSFENTFQTGQIILGVILVIGTIVGTIYGVKWRTAYEVEVKVSEGLKHLADLKDTESKVLQGQLLEAKDLISQQAVTIARLEQLPNLERILQYMGDMAVKQDAAADVRLDHALRELHRGNQEHEERVVQRHKATLEELHAIREELHKERR